MTYVPVRPDNAGNLPIRRSIVAGSVPVEIKPGEVGVNAADGVMYVGTNDGKTGTIPGAVGFSKIVSLTQSAYDAITATASSTTLYIVTPDPVEE
jgi:hypothetical protein